MEIKKAYEITDAKISFVSLVDKAANKKKFLITKADDGKAQFTTYGRIVKTFSDGDKHYITGIVYEPMTKDAHDNFMTEEEITKAAYYFIKSGAKIDLQHSFEPLTDVLVVESSIAKADYTIGEEVIKQGSWLLTIEIADVDIWQAIKKRKITGLSMGGVGFYSEEDVQLDSVEKTDTGAVNEPEQSEKKGVFKKLAGMLGFDVVEKGALADEYAKRLRANNFWAAFYALEDMLCYWDSWSGEQVLETDDNKVKEVLSDFTTIVEGILTSGEPVTKQLALADKPIEKAGKKMSSANRATLQSAYDALGVLLEAVTDVSSEDEEETEGKKDDGEKGKPEEQETKPNEGEEDDNKEETEVTKAEVETIVADAVAKAMNTHQNAQNGVQSISKANEGNNTPATEITPERVSEMVNEVVEKALKPQEQQMTVEQVQKMINKAVKEAVEPVLKTRGIPSNLNGSGVEKSAGEEHYLHGIL